MRRSFCIACNRG